MPLTRDFKETMKTRADLDPAFRNALLSEPTQLLLDGDLLAVLQALQSETGVHLQVRAVGKAA